MYDYDPLGRRIAKSKLNKQGEKQCHTQFIWAGSHLVQEIRKGKNGAETDRTFTYIYTHPDSYEPLAQCYKEGDNAEHTVNYFHCDQIGIPREMTDSQGKLIWKGRYDAWGQLIFEGTVQNQIDPLGLFAPALALPWLVDGLAYGRYSHGWHSYRCGGNGGDGGGW